MSSEPTSEVVKATSVTNPKKTSSVRLLNPQRIDVKSGEAQNFFVSSVVERNGRERDGGSFVLRVLHPYAAAWKEDYKENYRFLKEHGFPVPATVRDIEDSNDLLISDLRAKDKTVFSYNEMYTGKVNPVGLINNMEEVEEALSQIAAKADELGAFIGSDAYFVVLDANSHAEIILGDLGIGTNIPQKNEEYKKLLAERHQKAPTSAEAVQEFIDLIKHGKSEV